LIPVATAWIILGFDASQVFTELGSIPRSKRVEAARAKLEEARQTAKRLQFAHHPDRGGDPEKFKRVGEALKSLEEHTEAFAKAMCEMEKLELDPKRPFIKLGE
jgi:hypothetical protein